MIKPPKRKDNCKVNIINHEWMLCKSSHNFQLHETKLFVRLQHWEFIFLVDTKYFREKHSKATQKRRAKDQNKSVHIKSGSLAPERVLMNFMSHVASIDARRWLWRALSIDRVVVGRESVIFGSVVDDVARHGARHVARHGAQVHPFLLRNVSHHLHDLLLPKLINEI